MRKSQYNEGLRWLKNETHGFQFNEIIPCDVDPQGYGQKEQKKPETQKNECILQYKETAKIKLMK